MLVKVRLDDKIKDKITYIREMNAIAKTYRDPSKIYQVIYEHNTWIIDELIHLNKLINELGQTREASIIYQIGSLLDTLKSNMAFYTDMDNYKIKPTEKRVPTPDKIFYSSDYLISILVAFEVDIRPFFKK